jgi:hypothetical protein
MIIFESTSVTINISSSIHDFILTLVCPLLSVSFFLNFSPRRGSADPSKRHAFTQMSSSSLFPGYAHVDAFGPDEDYESEEEVVYVTLDLGTAEPTLVPNSSTYRLIVRMHPLELVCETCTNGSHGC